MNSMRRLITLVSLSLLPAVAFAQGDITGKVSDAQTGDALVGANVVVQGTTLGAAADANGMYKISGVPAGSYTLDVTFIGYEAAMMKVRVTAGASATVNVRLQQKSILSEGVLITASRARDRETPVAFSDISKEAIEVELGSRDIPEVLNTTPNVYATAQGGGAGDSRINVRGFNQRNIAVMINGVPVNDMENGWVYWSNWDGLGDVTSSIQVQRGLGATNLAIASVGGTLNIVTDVASLNPGFGYKQEIGNDGFLKSTVSASTGLMENGFAASASIVRKVGDGLVNEAWTDAWAYFGALSYSPNKSHKFDLFAIGAPQRHGQRLYSQAIEVWDTEFAADEGIDVSGVTARGLNYNPNYGVMNNIPVGAQLEFYNGEVHRWRDANILMERENYYHKPQFNLNWYWSMNEKALLTNVFYYSRGQGGGTGTYGSWPGYDSNGLLDLQGAFDRNRMNFDDTYASDPLYNANETRSRTALRNSVNSHYWTGYLGTLNYNMSDNTKMLVGLDARYYIGEHFREIRNLLGGGYYVDFRDANQASPIKRLGDKINYHNDGLTRWVGGYGQVEHKFTQDFTAVATASVSQTGYNRIDYFLPRNADGSDAETGWNSFTGFTFKAGANYNVSDAVNVYANAGYLEVAPKFDAVYSFTNDLYEDPLNEKVTSIELGTGYRGTKLGANVNLYYTNWADRTFDTSFRNDAGERFFYLVPGIDAIHQGIELDFKYRPSKMFSLRGAVALSDNEWQNDVTSIFSPEADPTAQDEIRVYSKGLKVGDSAQFTTALTASVKPIDDVYVNLTMLRFDSNYADFDPSDRQDASDTAQPWQIPAYNLMNLHAGYTLPIQLANNGSIRLTGHIFNLLDTAHITDADDRGAHTADDARVFFGLGRRYNIGLNFQL